MPTYTHVDLRRGPADGRRGHRGRRPDLRRRDRGRPDRARLRRRRHGARADAAPGVHRLGARAGLRCASIRSRARSTSPTGRPARSTSTTRTAPTSGRSTRRAELEGWQPLGIAFDTAGNLYVDRRLGAARSGSSSSTGRATSSDARREAGLNFPNGDRRRRGRQRLRHRQQQRPPARLRTRPARRRPGRPGRRATGNLGLPRGVAVDGQGRVFVVDATGQGVFVYGTSRTGRDGRLDYLGFFGGEGVGNGAVPVPQRRRGRRPRSRLRGRHGQRPRPGLELLSSR